jgi:hypothetical protein
LYRVFPAEVAALDRVGSLYIPASDSQFQDSAGFYGRLLLVRRHPGDVLGDTTILGWVKDLSSIEALACGRDGTLHLAWEREVVAGSDNREIFWLEVPVGQLRQ